MFFLVGVQEGRSIVGSCGEQPQCLKLAEVCVQGEASETKLVLEQFVSDVVNVILHYLWQQSFPT